MSDTEAENTMSLGEFIEDLKHEDPEMGKVLENLINDYEEIAERHTLVVNRRKEAISKYFKSEKGKQKTREASRRYYEKKIKSGKPRGRPPKNPELNNLENN